MITLALLAALVAPSTTWTVDDDGPADFAQISEAVAQVRAGDVLLVEPGEYVPFILDKRVAILGEPGGPRPHVFGVTRVIGASFTLAGLDLEALRVDGAAGRGRIDDCRVGSVGDAGQDWAVVLDGCAQVVVSRTNVKGSDAYSQAHIEAGGSALKIVTSNVMLVDCMLTGAQGLTSEGFSPYGGQGGIGLSIELSSQVVAVGSTIQGGLEGFATCVFCECHDGPAGSAVELVSSSLVVRGSSGDKVIAGSADPLCPPILPGFAFDALGSVVVASGAAIVGNSNWNASQYITPSPAQPFLEIEGPDSAGAHKTIQLHGPAGASCLLVASFAPAYAPLSQFDDELWVGLADFFVLVPLVTLGQEQPLTLGLDVPASLTGIEGVSIELQPFFPGLPSAVAPGKSIAGNVAEIILRF
jgi:hypothetical protein